jgi:hypothetical protein
MLEIPFCKGNRANDSVGYMLEESSFLQWKLKLYNTCSMGRDSSVGIATAYGLECLGVVSLWSEIFRNPLDLPREPPNILSNGYRLSHGGKAAWVWRWPLATFSAEVKDRVHPYLYLPSGPSWPVIRCNLPLPLPFTIPVPERSHVKTS